MYLRSCHSNTALVITTSDNTTARGYLYGNSSNNIGILDSNGNWAIRHVASSCTDFRIGNSVKMNLYTGCLCHSGVICAASCLRAPTVCATTQVPAPNPPETHPRTHPHPHRSHTGRALLGTC